MVTDGSGFISAATTTATEIGYVNGVTSAIQTQLNNKISQTSAEIYTVFSGATDAWNVALTPGIGSYTDGMSIYIRVLNSNVGAVTLDAGAGALAVGKIAGGSVVALAAGDVLGTTTVHVVYNSLLGFFLLQNPIASPGTVRSVATGIGLQGGSITTTGTINLSTTSSVAGRLTLTSGVPVTTAECYRSYHDILYALFWR